MKSEMRYLNRIVFINSAAVKYAEISLDGNVHLIGTQGVGKSTLLRSILFFYNADTLKLGIPLNKKSFAEHYFSYANSFIVYEISRETGSTCVMAFKSQGRISYRFIDSQYNRDFFISSDGKAHESWDKIRAALDDARVTYSNKIDRYEEYRNILYGNQNEIKKELKRFSLLESKQYQNIPRTIQNVFLSSHLEAEFIKQTIIMSLNEEDIRINLDTYNHHLSNFEGQINDINLFRQPAKIEQGENIARRYVELRKIEKDKKELAHQLSWTLDNHKIKAPELKEELQGKEIKQEELKKLIAEINSAAEQKRLSINERISVLKNKLQTIAEKENYYSEIKINEIIQRLNKKPNLTSESSDLEKEKTLLTKEFSKITDRYDALRKELNHQHQAFLQRKKSESLDHESIFLKEKDAIQDNYNKTIQEIRSQNAENLKEAHREVLQKLEFKKSLEIKEAEIKHAAFSGKEINNIESDILKIHQLNRELALEKTLANNQIKLLQQQWEIEETNTSDLFTAEQGKRFLEIQEVIAEIEQIASKIQKQGASFHGWLSDNISGWENNIGKVCNGQVLLLENLQPSRSENGENDSIYGLKINLNEVDLKPKTLDDYRKDKKSKESKLEELKNESAKLQQNNIQNLEKIKKRFQPKIKEYKDRDYEIDYDLEKNKKNENEKKVQLSDLIISAKSEKEKALVDILTQIQNAEQEQRNATAKEIEIDKRIKERLTSEEAVKVDKLKALIQAKDQIQENINKEIAEKTTSNDERFLQIQEEEAATLKDQGANIKRLTQINSRLTFLAEELKYIENVAVKEVIEYRKDKTELLDHKDKFETEKTELEEKLANEESKRVKKVTEQTQKLSKIEAAIFELNGVLESIKQDLQEFEGFTNTDCHLNIGHHLYSVHEEFANTLKARQIIDNIKSSYYAGITKSNELKEIVNKFLSNFSSGNLFNFRTNLNTESEYQQFATELSDFISQDRISEFEKRVNERYAEIIKLVGKETTEFTSREGEINKIIREINDDFDKKNFVGIIQKIELRMDQSTNPIVEILKRIKNFNDENSSDLGEVNLFSSTDRATKNKMAVDLLKQLVKEIIRSKRDYISLSDSFELKFRVIENYTDTGWVEKISNVGSEGTDILVKAMINIMLLNVFKEGASKRFKDFKLHCVMDEIGKLHPGNVRGLLKFANDRNILLINGSPTENDAMAFRHIYKLEKDSKAMTKVKRIISRLN